MKKKIKYSAVAVLTIGTAVITAINICTAKKKAKRKKEVQRLISAVTDILNNSDVCNFDIFCEYLDEYYGIKAKRFGYDVVEYYSDKFSSPICSYDVSNYTVYNPDCHISNLGMLELEEVFELNCTEKI